MASRDIKDLVPNLKVKAEKVIEECKARGIDILIYCTLRDFEEQARLYRNGRTLANIEKKAATLRKRGFGDLADILIGVGPQSGKAVLTNAGPGESWHNFRQAFDAVPMSGGKALWKDMEKYRIYGEIVEEVGLVWGGRWNGLVDLPHAQLRRERSPLNDPAARILIDSIIKP